MCRREEILYRTRIERKQKKMIEKEVLNQEDEKTKQGRENTISKRSLLTTNKQHMSANSYHT